jgi:choline dehydrogenase-like flavoprotein
MIEDAANLAAGSEITADICIIGTGAAGISLAIKLLHTGKSILLLESAAKNVPGNMTPEKAQILEAYGTYPPDLTAGRDHRGYDPVAQELNGGRESQEMDSFDTTFLMWSRLRAYGGTTNCWGGWTRPLDAIDFDRSDLQPSVAWPFSRDEIYPGYYNEAMHLCSMGDICVERYADEAFWRERVPDIEFLDVSGTTGGAMRNAAFLVMNRQAWDFQTVWGPDLVDAPNCRVLLNANVRVVVGTAGDRSVDHLFVSTIVDRRAGIDFTVKADQYIVATGGTEVARLLLYSGSDGFANPYGWLGRCFQIHPLNKTFATYSPGTRFPPGQVANLYSGQTQVPIGKLPPKLFATFTPSDDTLRQRGLRNFRAQVNFVSRSINLNWEQAPNLESRVLLTTTEKGPFFGDPLAHLAWQTLPVDTVKTPDEATDLLNAMLAAFGYGGKITRCKKVITWAGDHHMGATRMSHTARDGYVDSNCRVHGVDNLYIAGSSVFPTTGYANPTLTIIALAARLAHHLAGIS